MIIMKSICLRFPSLKPTVSYFDDLDNFKDFVKEFLVIVYNDALMSKLDFLNEPTISPQHMDEFNLKESLSEYDEEEQNVLYFNDLFPFNVIYLNDSKSDKDNDNDKIDIKQSSGCNVFSIWKAFGGNTRDFGSFGEEMYKTTDPHQHLSRISTHKLETASQITRDAVTTNTKMASQDVTPPNWVVAEYGSESVTS
ncbi:hypothetical protein Tco_0382167 [Tanacetum coccineum]